jgi:hypothetical protein
VTAVLSILGMARRFAPAAPYAAIALLAVLAWHFDRRAIANADALRTQAAQFRQAQIAAQQGAQQALDHENAVYLAKATEAQNAYQVQLSDARASADRYIVAHRVQPATAGGDAGATVATTDGGHADVPAGLSPASVMVSSDDVQTCTDAVTYALQAHDWADTIAR